MICFRKVKQINEWDCLDDKLYAIFLWIYHEYSKYDIIITEIFRNRADQINIYTHLVNPKTGKLYLPEEVPYTVHGTNPCRGIDLFFTSKKWPLSKKRCYKIEKHVNSIYEYDPKRPNMKVCNYHRTTISGWHFHIQVHPNTIKRNLSIV